VTTTDHPGAPAATPADLPATLRRLEAALDARCTHGEMTVPPYPAIALRVQEAMARPHAGLGEVAGLIGADPILAADILRCANSAMYRRGAHILDLTQALTRIGVQQVMRLLLASGLAGTAHGPGPLALLRRMVWIEGMASAAVAQELARRRGLRAEEAFTLGLLHDFGKVVALSCLEALLEAEGSGESFHREAWEAVVERRHVEAGLLMAARWRLPPLVQEIIGCHHGAPGACSDPGLLEVIRATDQVVHLLLTSARVAPDDLAGVAGMTPAEREPVARVVEQIPDFVAAFETPASSVAPGPQRVAPTESTVEAVGRALRLEVAVSVARKTRRFTSTAVSEGGLLLSGEEPLPENRLLEATLFAERPFKLWILSRHCRREGDGWVVEIQPFGLTGDAKERWSALLDAGRPR